MNRSQAELVQDVLTRGDKTGELGSMIGGFEAILDSGLGRLLLSATGTRSEVTKLMSTQRKLFDCMARSILLFAPRGWAPTSLAPTDDLQAALDVYDRTKDIDLAEERLLQGWNDTDMLSFCKTRLLSLCAGQEDLWQIARLRSESIGKALAHHKNGAFEASVPIALAQVDGLVLDMTEGKNGFFIRVGDRSHLQDTETLAGVGEGLRALQAYYGASQESSGATGGVSRHGIMHGRELGYDTRLNSTKCFVLLLAVIEWAQPLARRIADRRLAERQARYAGMDGVDPDRRRLDARGFADLRLELQDVWLGQRLEWMIHQRLSNSLELLAKHRTSRRAFSATMKLRVNNRDSTFIAWAPAESGWVLGIGGDGHSTSEWFYSGRDEPPIDLASNQWSADRPADWVPPA